MNTQPKSSTSSIIAGFVAAAGLFLATIVLGQTQNAEKTDPEQNQEVAREESPVAHRGRDRGRRLETFDKLPDGAQTLTLENGKELYFHEGQLFTFAESRSMYIQIPGALFTQQGRQQLRHHNRSGKAKMRDVQTHRPHNRRFHHGRRWI